MLNSTTSFGPKKLAIFSLASILILVCAQGWVPGFFHDGYLYAALGKNAAAGKGWLIPHAHPKYYDQFFQHPPLYFILEGLFFKIFGSDWWQARLFQALNLWGVMMVVMFFPHQRNRTFPWLGGLLFLLIPAVLKKASFPHLDFMVTLWIWLGLYFFSRALENPSRVQEWLGLGICFGLALLTKGPVGLFLPYSIVLYLVFEKRWGFFKIKGPYIATLIGLILFGLWPLLTIVFHQTNGLAAYVDQQFESTFIDGRGAEKIEFFNYFIVLLKYAGPWLFALILLSWVSFKRSIPQEIRLGLLFFWVVFIPLCLMRHKYSHYLIPLYPALALALNYYLSLWPKVAHKTQAVLSSLLILLNFLFLIYPFRIIPKRDPVLHKIESSFPLAKRWVLVDEPYALFNILNFLSYRGIDFDRVSLKNLTSGESDIVLMKEGSFEGFENSNDYTVELKDDGLVVLVKK